MPRRQRQLAVGVFLVAVLGGAILSFHQLPLVAAQDDDAAASRAAFLAAYPVFMHARCLNCHPVGDVPFQGDDSHPHEPPVKRGPEGKGKFAMKCANCHQPENFPGENMPPGNPNWHLPKPEMPLVFEGKSACELAIQLKDPQRNGGKSLEQILHHVEEDQLVLGGWNPGDGRSTPPLSHAEFAKKMRQWVEKGAAIPE
jgi:mono/diheme cytochrome c family protein